MKRALLWTGVGLIFVIVIIPLLTLLVSNYNPAEVRVRKVGDMMINVLNHETNKLMQMDLEEYIVGVVAAEMPASFELEALKAQAVAARTYAYKRLQEPDPRIRQLHPQADMVTNPNICQAWICDEDMKKKWGYLDYLKYSKKIQRAVEETKGQIIVYQGKTIDPVYHASCGGSKTEDSGDVWKYNFPYLTSVQCSNHEDKHIRDTKTIPFRNIDVALGSNINAIPAASLQGNNKHIQILETTKAGRIKTIKFGGQIISGVEIRAKLGLKSTWFTWTVDKDSVTFITRGYGHAVGMCQYGTNDFALKGKKYDQILKHYYSGVEVIQMK